MWSENMKTLNPVKALKKPRTNAERIRSMTDEELARFMADEVPHGDCYGCDLDCIHCDKGQFEDSCQNAWYMWLKQPAEEGAK